MNGLSMTACGPLMEIMRTPFLLIPGNALVPAYLTAAERSVGMTAAEGVVVPVTLDTSARRDSVLKNAYLTAMERSVGMMGAKGAVVHALPITTV